MGTRKTSATILIWSMGLQCIAPAWADEPTHRSYAEFRPAHEPVTRPESTPYQLIDFTRTKTDTAAASKKTLLSLQQYEARSRELIGILRRSDSIVDIATRQFANTLAARMRGGETFYGDSTARQINAFRRMFEYTLKLSKNSANYSGREQDIRDFRAAVQTFEEAGGIFQNDKTRKDFGKKLKGVKNFGSTLSVIGDVAEFADWLTDQPATAQIDAQGKVSGMVKKLLANQEAVSQDYINNIQLHPEIGVYDRQGMFLMSSVDSSHYMKTGTDHRGKVARDLTAQRQRIEQSGQLTPEQIDEIGSQLSELGNAQTGWLFRKMATAPAGSPEQKAAYQDFLDNLAELTKDTKDKDYEERCLNVAKVGDIVGAIGRITNNKFLQAGGAVIGAAASVALAANMVPGVGQVVAVAAAVVMLIEQLFSIFGPQGPSIEEVILDEVRALRQQIHSMHVQLSQQLQDHHDESMSRLGEAIRKLDVLIAITEANNRESSDREQAIAKRLESLSRQVQANRGEIQQNFDQLRNQIAEARTAASRLPINQALIDRAAGKPGHTNIDREVRDMSTSWVNQAVYKSRELTGPGLKHFTSTEPEELLEELKPYRFGLTETYNRRLLLEALSQLKVSPEFKSPLPRLPSKMLYTPDMFDQDSFSHTTLDPIFTADLMNLFVDKIQGKVINSTKPLDPFRNPVAQAMSHVDADHEMQRMLLDALHSELKATRHLIPQDQSHRADVSKLMPLLGRYESALNAFNMQASENFNSCLGAELGNNPHYSGLAQALAGKGKLELNPTQHRADFFFTNTTPAPKVPFCSQANQADKSIVTYLPLGLPPSKFLEAIPQEYLIAKDLIGGSFEFCVSELKAGPETFTYEAKEDEGIHTVHRERHAPMQISFRLSYQTPEGSRMEIGETTVTSEEKLRWDKEIFYPLSAQFQLRREHQEAPVSRLSDDLPEAVEARKANYPIFASRYNSQPNYVNAHIPKDLIQGLYSFAVIGASDEEEGLKYITGNERREAAALWSRSEKLRASLLAAWQAKTQALRDAIKGERFFTEGKGSLADVGAAFDLQSIRERLQNLTARAFAACLKKEANANESHSGSLAAKAEEIDTLRAIVIALFTVGLGDGLALNETLMQRLAALPRSTDLMGIDPSAKELLTRRVPELGYFLTSPAKYSRVTPHHPFIEGALQRGLADYEERLKLEQRGLNKLEKPLASLDSDSQSNGNTDAAAAEVRNNVLHTLLNPEVRKAGNLWEQGWQQLSKKTLPSSLSELSTILTIAESQLNGELTEASLSARAHELAPLWGIARRNLGFNATEAEKLLRAFGSTPVIMSATQLYPVLQAQLSFDEGKPTTTSYQRVAKFIEHLEKTVSSAMPSEQAALREQLLKEHAKTLIDNKVKLIALRQKWQKKKEDWDKALEDSKKFTGFFTHGLKFKDAGEWDPNIKKGLPATFMDHHQRYLKEGDQFHDHNQENEREMVLTLDTHFITLVNLMHERAKEVQIMNEKAQSIDDLKQLETELNLAPKTFDVKFKIYTSPDTEPTTNFGNGHPTNRYWRQPSLPLRDSQIQFTDTSGDPDVYLNNVHKLFNLNWAAVDISVYIVNQVTGSQYWHHKYPSRYPKRR